MASFRLARLRLGRPAFDASALLERWSSLSGSRQGFAIEKDSDEVFVGAAPFETLRVRRGRAYAQSGGRSRELPGNPFAALGARLREHRVAGARPFETGAVGFLSYEMVRHLERVPAPAEPQEAALMLFPAILRADRRAGTAELCALLPEGAGAAAALRRAEKLAERLAPALQARAKAPASAGRAPVLEPAGGRAAFVAGVAALKRHIRAGDIFQAVLSESFSAPWKAGGSELWRRLRALGPSPYSFYLRDGARELVGASPERLVKVENGVAVNCPIAGTRPRGVDAARDRALEQALRKSPKERAEHLMLVDLARNDLGRVCSPGSVRVRSLMQVRRFPNVMHLVSEVEGRLERGACAWDVLGASFPAGTVSGAPKVRAMELLAGLERRPRGFYAGAVVQHDFSGNLDSCLAIRAAQVERGRVRVQAGAGVVADSRPDAEYREVLAKLGSLRKAIGAAE